jgi:hypothetical protein
MRVMILGNWAPYIGTDYCEALGIYDSLEEAQYDAEIRAWETWEPDEDEDIEDEGPDFWVEEYDPDKHDMLMAGVLNGSFADTFAKWEAG